MENQRDEDYEEEIEHFPESVKAIARKYPANTCWRSTEDPEFHYTIIDYARATHKETREEKITVTLVHGSGTRRAGIATFGQDPQQLIPCGCGKWKPPTGEEKEAQHQKILAHRTELREALKDPLEVGDWVILKNQPDMGSLPLPVRRIESGGVHIWVGFDEELGPFFRQDLKRYDKGSPV